MNVLGTMLDMKYKNEPRYFQVDSIENLNEEQKRNEIKRIDEEELRLNNKAILLTILAISSFVIATTLLIKRKKIVR